MVTDSPLRAVNRTVSSNPTNSMGASLGFRRERRVDTPTAPIRAQAAVDPYHRDTS